MGQRAKTERMELSNNKSKIQQRFHTLQLTHQLTGKVAELLGFTACLCKGKKQEIFCTQGWATMQQPRDVLM